MLIKFTCLLPVLVLFITPVNTANEKQVRLDGGFNVNEGAIQVNRNGDWKYLCDETPYFFKSLAGDLVCKELDYVSAGRTSSRSVRDPSIGYWKSNITCSPNDVSLMNCSNTGWLETETCKTKTYTTIYCFKNVKFANRYNRASTGYVSVYNASQKKYQILCQDGFTDTTARVFCKEYGFKSGRILSRPSSSISNNTMMDTTYSCTGRESRLGDCPTVPASASCTNSYPVAQAICTGDLTITDKVHRMFSGYGVVEVYDDEGETMTLCAEGFNENTAKVVCREQDYGGNGTLFPYPLNLHDIRTVYKDTLKKSFNCVGTESRLKECPSTIKESCSNEIGASVLCQQDSNSIEDGVTRISEFFNDGGVEVMYHGIWGSICVDQWDDNAAKVICGTTSTHAKALTSLLRGSSDVTWIYDCTGKEDNINSCQFSTDGTKFNCSSDHQAVAYCYNDTFKYSLSGGGTNYGYVQATKDGKTGFVLDSNGAYTNTMAEAACNSVGFHGGLPYQMNETSTTYWWNVSINQEYYSFPRLQLENATTKTSPVQQKYLSVYCHGKVKLDGSYIRALEMGNVVQYKYNKFYAICADGFTKTEGDAVCRQLGFPQAVKVNDRYFASTEPLGFHDFKCTKGANSTADCTSRFTGTGVGCTSGKSSVECGDGNIEGPASVSNGRKVQVSVIIVMMCLFQMF